MQNTTSTLKTALVTGGTRGIGRAIAQQLAAAGYKVVLTGRSDGEAVAAQIRQNGGKAQFWQLDVTQEAAVEAAFKRLADEFGGCDVLINNAGIAKDFLLMRSKVSDWQEIINVNLIGTLLCSRAAVKQMMRKQWGRIINIGSVVGATGNPGQTVYSATKAAIVGFTKSLAKEIGSRQITVNTIAPGFITTEMTANLSDAVKAEYAKSIPLGRMGTPEDIAALVVFLASDASAYITGQELGMNGGMA